MAENTKIEWADHTFNPWIGCTEVSKACTGGGGCDGCYAKVSTPVRVLRSKGFETWGPGATRVRTSEDYWKQPIKWNAKAARLGIRYRVFCASLADVFDNEVPDAWRADLFALIRATPNLDWLLLTKRIGNVLKLIWKAVDASESVAVRDYLAQWISGGLVPRNIWIGATIVNQPEADRDIPKLLAVPAAKRFLSIEPMLGPVDVSFAMPWRTLQDRLLNRSLDWVICGGESGPNARPMHPDWARSLRDQCQAAGVPFFFKQWGEWAEFDPDHLPGVRKVVEGDPEFEAMASQCDAFIRMDGLVVTSMSEVSRSDTPYRGLVRLGKKAAGRLLDGREWNEVPA